MKPSRIRCVFNCLFGNLLVPKSVISTEGLPQLVKFKFDALLP